jgi:hypothetical protein
MSTSTGSVGPAGIPERPIPGNPAAPGAAGSDTSTGGPAQAASFDPLRLCIYTTVALITWIGGPFAVLVFAGLGLAGYWKAHQAGLTRTKCYLRDVRLVLLYLGAIALIAAAASVFKIHGWFG